ncbi:hypothetical protein BRC93_05900 [Halobacteriales archaeon QS_5_70_15]|nr:MAG: hypothetical protein BRC93_05900 [Halobacteriales archaeon QS_5_70_15]
MWETEVAIRHRGCPISDVSIDHPEVRFENVRRVASGDGRAKRLLRFEGERAAVESFVEDFRDHPSADSLERADEERGWPGVAHYVSEIDFAEGNPPIRRLVEQAGCFRHPTVVVRSGIEHWTIYTGNKDEVREFVDSVERFDNDVNVLRSVHVEALTDGEAVRHGPFRSSLTDRQAQTFRAALSIGYYDGHSQVTMEDIAAHLGVHRSTAGEHLKRAEDALLSEVGSRLFPGVEAGHRPMKH